MKSLSGSDIHIEYDNFMEKYKIIYIHRNIMLPHLRIVLNYGARDGDIDNEGLLHLLEHYLDSYFQKKLFSKGVFVTSQTSKETIQFDFTFNFSSISFFEIYDIVISAFSISKFSDNILKTEQMRVESEIEDFSLKSDLVIEEMIDRQIWSGGLSKTIRGKNPYIFGIDSIQSMLRVLSATEKLIIFMGNSDTNNFFQQTKIFCQEIASLYRLDRVVLDKENLFSPCHIIDSIDTVKNRKMYLSYGKFSPGFLSHKDISKWIMMSTILAGHRNSILPKTLFSDKNITYSIYAIPCKYRYENIIKLKCICRESNFERISNIMKDTFNNLAFIVTDQDVKYGKALLEQYISETFSNNIRLINFITDIFLTSHCDEYMNVIEDSIHLTRELDIDEFREFVIRYLQNSQEYSYFKVLQKGERS